MTVCGHDDCRRMSGYPATCLHGATSAYPYSGGGVVAAAQLAHRHRWVYDGQTATGTLIYHCDEHDPPVVRVVVTPTVTP